MKIKKIVFIIFLLIFFLNLSEKPEGKEFSSVVLPQSSVDIRDRYGMSLQTLLTRQETYQQWVSLDKISVWVLQATIVAEDRRFYQHCGIDAIAILRAFWQNIKAGKVISGASTITQQVTRINKPQKKNIWGKIKEAFFAVCWERKYTKEEILEQYLNWVELGNLTQGIQAASQYYFGVPAKEVSLAQAALLAGIIQAPSRLNPFQNPQGALARRNRVLEFMKQEGVISEQMYDMAISEPLGVVSGERPFQAPHFVRRISAEVKKGGVESTLDKEIQLYAEKTLQNHLSLLQKNHVTNGAVVVLDNLNSEVLAYVGSADFFNKKYHGQVDGVKARRQPGSTLKPFVYALAMENGLTSATLLKDEDTFFEGGFRPRNYDEHFHGVVSVRKALANSYNVPVIKVAEKLGASSMLYFLRKLGFDSLHKPAEFYGLGLALGNGEVTLLELANAYATLARGGILRPVVFARNPLIQQNLPVKRVLSESISYIITDILSDNMARADAFGLNSALYMPFSSATKTGTSKDYKDNFAVGYTPRITVAVWVGNFDGSSMQKVSGISGAAPILHDVLSYTHNKYPSGDFPRPYDVISARICEESALLAGPNCLHAREEIFKQGTQPQQYCTGHHEPVNKKLSFIFPKEDDVFKYDPSLPSDAQQILLQVCGNSNSCYWVVNGKRLAHSGMEMWFPLKKGTFDVEVVCGQEKTKTHFEVL